MTLDARPAGIILAGGLSTRMGADKARLVVDGKRMVDRVVAALLGAGVTPIVIAGGAEGLVDGIEVVPDAGDGHEGPMAGISAAWRTLRAGGHDPVVVVSCDLPRLSSSVVRELVAESVRHVHGAVAHDGASIQPLVAAYRAPAFALLEEAFDKGERSLRRLFDQWELGTIGVDRRVVTDADRPDDLTGFDVEWPDEPGGDTGPQ